VTRGRGVERGVDHSAALEDLATAASTSERVPSETAMMAQEGCLSSSVISKASREGRQRRADLQPRVERVSVERVATPQSFVTLIAEMDFGHRSLAG
jgi:hypothetical protein